MTLLWFITGASLLLALVAWSQARRTARRLEQLTQMHWELKFQHGELRAQLRQLTGSSNAREAGSGDAARGSAPGAPAQTDGAFVPLASLRR